MKQLKQVKTQEILQDNGRFLFLRNQRKISVAFSGIPVLWAGPDGYIPVILPIPETSDGETPALVYPADSTYEQVLSEQFEILDALTDIHAFDIARLLALLERYVPGYNKRSWSRRLKIGEEQIPDYLALTAYQNEWEEYLRQKNVSLKRMLSFSPAAIRDVLSRLLGYNPGINILEQISLLLREIAGRDKRQISAVWDACIPQALFRDLEDNGKAIPEQVKQRLYEERYPLINAFQKRIGSQLQTLNIPESIQISLDPLLEVPGISIRIRARSRAELENAQNWLDKNRYRLNTLIGISTLQEENE